MKWDPEGLRFERALPNRACEEQMRSLSFPSSSVSYRIGGSPPSLPPTPSPFISSPSMNQGQPESLSALHTLVISLITTVGGYVLFQYQSKKLSLFDEHGNIMRAVFMILFLYVMGLMAEFKLKNRSNYLPIIKLFTPLVGLLVVVLLLFILSPGLGLAASIIWVLLAVEPTIRLFQGTVQCFRGMILHFQSQTATSNFDIEESDPHEIQANAFPV